MEKGRDCPPVRMGAPVARKHGKGKRGCLGGLDGWGDRARHPVAGGGVQKKRCSAGRAADRAKRERAAPPPVQAAKKAALSLPPGGTKGCRKSGARHRWQDGWVKKEVRPGGRKMWKREGTARRFAWAGTGARHPFPGRRGEKDKRERRRCAQRRRWKIPWKAASDEPLGKHRLGGIGKTRGGSPQKASSDEPNGKHRLGGPAKPRRRPPQTSPSASIASATLEKPAMFAPATRL